MQTLIFNVHVFKSLMVLHQVIGRLSYHYLSIDGRGKGQTLAAKFRTQELAESFKKVFKNCQARMSKGEESSILSSKTMGHSNTP